MIHMLTQQDLVVVLTFDLVSMCPLVVLDREGNEQQAKQEQISSEVCTPWSMAMIRLSLYLMIIP